MFSNFLSNFGLHTALMNTWNVLYGVSDDDGAGSDSSTSSEKGSSTSKTSKDNDDVFIFNGWMFSSSPSIAPFDHPVYDVWLIGCY